MILRRDVKQRQVALICIVLVVFTALTLVYHQVCCDVDPSDRANADSQNRLAEAGWSNIMPA